MLVTFSGVDGAGKTTLIRGMRAFLEDRHCRVTVLTMYDHVGVYALLRSIRRWVQGGIAGNRSKPPAEPSVPVGVSPHPLVRLAWHVLRSDTVKLIVLLPDVLILLIYRLYLERLQRRILIIDRYFYDSLADVADGHRWFYIRMLLRIIPTPDLAIFVDVAPERAFLRKGEHSIDHLRFRRAAYQKIFNWVRRPVLLANEDLNLSLRALVGIAMERIPAR